MHEHLSEIEILIIEISLPWKPPKLYQWVENCKRLKKFPKLEWATEFIIQLSR